MMVILFGVLKMPKRSPMKKYKYDKDPLADIKEASKEIKKAKNPQPVIDYVLKKLGTPENLSLIHI